MSNYNRNNQTIVTVRDLKIPARIGIYEEEHLHPQPVLIQVNMTLADYQVPHDRIEDTVSYEGVVTEIRRLSQIHHELVEKLAEHIADYCLRDNRIHQVEVSVEKTDIFPDCNVGARIIRTKNPV